MDRYELLGQKELIDSDRESTSDGQSQGLRVMGFFEARHLIFLFFAMVTLGVFYEHLVNLFVQSLNHDTNDYIPLVPLVSAFFFYLDRKSIFEKTGYSVPVGLGTVAVGVVVYLMGMTQGHRLSQNDYMSLMTLSIVIIWIGGFVCCYGLRAFRGARFALLFLFFIVPIPTFAMQTMIAILQERSAEATATLFGLVGVPVLRDGFVFHLTGMSIEVAEECSGIHSAIALLLTSIVAGQLFLTGAWRKVALAAAVFPIAVMKNGLRIVTLTLLGNYVDERILSSALHRQGGVPFFVLAVSVLFVALWVLRWSQRKVGPAFSVK